MGKKYLDTKNNSLESSVLGVWETAIEEGEAIRDAAQMTKEVTKEEVELDEGEYAVTFQKGSQVGARNFRTIYVQAKNDDEAIKKAEKSKELERGFKYSSVRKEEAELPNMRDALMQVRAEKHDTHVDPEDREELDKEPDGEGGVETAKKMKRSKEPAPNISEASGDKEAYKKFFDAALKKFKVSSPAELKGDQKKKFFDYIDKNWEADNEKAEAAMSQVREFKIQSMKAALARVWGMKEGKNPFKKEDDDKENKKRVKTETGKKAAVIDINPKIAD